MNQSRPGFLVLEDKNNPDGLFFEGYLFGAEPNQPGQAGSKDRGYGEVIFNTSMTGYQEILTDPSYYGQMVCMTYPHIGNTGVNSEDPESEHPWCAGLIVHDWNEEPSNWRAEKTLETYLKENEIPGIAGVDTRKLTRHLRSSGVVRGILIRADQKSDAKNLLKKLPSFEGRDLILEVTTKKPYRFEPKGPAQGRFRSEKPARTHKVVALDFGTKRNLLRSLHGLGCEIEVMPAQTTAAQVLAQKPDGVFLANGPGDPAAATYAHQTVRELLGKLPIFGVCMGHQVLAHAIGGSTYKLKFGHRGANHPVLNRKTGRVEISSQNHGYAVDERSLPADTEITHINLFDRTVAGIEIQSRKAYSVQYHPEACPGPHDSSSLFEKFIDMMNEAPCTKNS